MLNAEVPVMLPLNVFAVGLRSVTDAVLAVNVPLFEWDVLSAYILFIDQADLARAWNRVTRTKPPKIATT